MSQLQAKRPFGPRLLMLGILLLLLAGCSPLALRIDAEKLECGQTSEADMRLLKISDTEDFEARLVRGDVSKPLIPNAHRCLVLTRDQRGYELIVRSSSNPLAGLIVPVDEIPEGLSFRKLETNSPIVQSSTRTQCVSREMLVSTLLPLVSTQSAQKRAQYPLTEIRIFDSAKTLVYKQTRKLLADEKIQLALSSGHYQVELVDFDGFVPDQRPAADRCTMTVDREAPTAELAVKGLELYGHGSGALRVTPGQQLKVVVTDANYAKVFACARRRLDEQTFEPACSMDQYEVIDQFTVPASGLWDLYYYAEDGIGNRSALGYTSLAVIQTEVLNQIRLLDQQISQYRLNFEDFKAFKTYQRLVNLAGQLVLKEELRAIYWKLLGRAFELSNTAIVRWQASLRTAGPRKRTLASPKGDQALIIFKNRRLAIVDGTRLVVLAKSYESAAYIDDKTFVAYTYGGSGTKGSIDVYQNNELVRSYEVPGRYDELSLDSAGKRLFLYGIETEDMLVFSDFENLAKRSKFRLPREFVLYSYFKTKDQFLTSADDAFVFFYYDAYIVRLNTSDWSYRVHQTNDYCQVTNIGVISSSETYYYSAPDQNECTGFLRKITWQDRGTIESSVYPDREKSIDSMVMRGPFFAAVSRKAKRIWIKDFRTNPPVDREFNFMSADATAPEFVSHPSLPNIVFLAQAGEVHRYDLASQPEQFYKNSVEQTVWHATEILPLAEPDQFVLFREDGLLEKYWFNRRAPTLAPLDRGCGVSCIMYPDRIFLGIVNDGEGFGVTAYTPQSNTGKRFNHEKAIAAHHLCGASRSCFLDREGHIFTWDLTTGESTQMYPSVACNSCDRLEYYEQSETLAVWDRNRARTYFIPLRADSSTIAFDVAGIPVMTQGPYLVVSRRETLSSVNNLDFYRRDGSLEKSIRLSGEEGPQHATAFAYEPAENVYTTMTATNLRAYDAKSLEEKMVRSVPAGYYFTGIKNSKEITLQPSMMAANDIPEWAYIYDLSTDGVKRLTWLDSLPLTAANARITSRGIIDSWGDFYEVKAEAFKAMADEFHLATIMAVDGTTFAGEFVVDPSSINAWLKTWPFAEMPEQEFPSGQTGN